MLDKTKMQTKTAPIVVAATPSASDTADEHDIEQDLSRLYQNARTGNIENADLVTRNIAKKAKTYLALLHTDPFAKIERDDIRQNLSFSFQQCHQFIYAQIIRTTQMGLLIRYQQPLKKSKGDKKQLLIALKTTLINEFQETDLVPTNQKMTYEVEKHLSQYSSLTKIEDIVKADNRMLSLLLDKKITIEQIFLNPADREAIEEKINHIYCGYYIILQSSTELKIEQMAQLVQLLHFKDRLNGFGLGRSLSQIAHNIRIQMPDDIAKMLDSLGKIFQSPDFYDELLQLLNDMPENTIDYIFQVLVLMKNNTKTSETHQVVTFYIRGFTFYYYNKINKIPTLIDAITQLSIDEITTHDNQEAVFVKLFDTLLDDLTHINTDVELHASRVYILELIHLLIAENPMIATTDTAVQFLSHNYTDITLFIDNFLLDYCLSRLKNPGALYQHALVLLSNNEHEKALRYLRLAANRHHTDAQLKFSELQKKQEITSEANDKKAHDYLTSAILTGDNDAYFGYAENNYQGKGTPKNIPLALHYYTRAHINGHPEASKKFNALIHTYANELLIRLAAISHLDDAKGTITEHINRLGLQSNHVIHIQVNQIISSQITLEVLRLAMTSNAYHPSTLLNIMTSMILYENILIMDSIPSRPLYDTIIQCLRNSSLSEKDRENNMLTLLHGLTMHKDKPIADFANRDVIQMALDKIRGILINQFKTQCASTLTLDAIKTAACIYYLTYYRIKHLGLNYMPRFFDQVLQWIGVNTSPAVKIIFYKMHFIWVGDAKTQSSEFKALLKNEIKENIDELYQAISQINWASGEGSSFVDLLKITNHYIIDIITFEYERDQTTPQLLQAIRQIDMLVLRDETKWSDTFLSVIRTLGPETILQMTNTSAVAFFTNRSLCFVYAVNANRITLNDNEAQQYLKANAKIIKKWIEQFNDFYQKRLGENNASAATSARLQTQAQTNSSANAQVQSTPKKKARK